MTQSDLAAEQWSTHLTLCSCDLCPKPPVITEGVTECARGEKHTHMGRDKLNCTGNIALDIYVNNMAASRARTVVFYQITS